MQWSQIWGEWFQAADIGVTWLSQQSELVKLAHVYPRHKAAVRSYDSVLVTSRNTPESSWLILGSCMFKNFLVLPNVCDPYLQLYGTETHHSSWVQRDLWQALKPGRSGMDAMSEAAGKAPAQKSVQRNKVSLEQPGHAIKCKENSQERF